MGPIRGSKKRKRAEKRAEKNAASVSSATETGDWWEEFSKRVAGTLPSSSEPNIFESIFKISRKTFNYICSLVREDLTGKPSCFVFTNGDALKLEDQVAVALRRLSSGDSLLNVGSAFGVNHSTVSQVTWRFVEAMEKRGLRHLRWPSSDEEMSAIKTKYEKIRGLPNCCGAIDTTYITMCLPAMDSSNKIWIDKEKNHSMVLQAITDPDMRIHDIVAGWPGSMSDSHVLRTSGFFKLCEKGLRLNGSKVGFSRDPDLDLREYIVGDESYPLLPWLMTPFQGEELVDAEAEFNRRHFATRVVAQRALARLKDVWGIIQGEMWRPDKHRLPRIVLVCCMLHNIVIDMDDEVTGEMTLSRHNDTRHSTQRCGDLDGDAFAVRDKLALFLATERGEGGRGESK